MKQLSVLLIAALLLPSLLCSCRSTDNSISYGHRDAIRHAVTEPDETERMTDADQKNFEKLVDGFLSRKPSVSVGASQDDCAFYTELLRENIYFFLVDDLSVDEKGIFSFSYAYSEEEQEEIIALMDDALLSIINRDHDDSDNKLDKILKLYYSVTDYLTYDHSSDIPTEITDPVFRYPSDEIFKALRDKTSRCYGFSYLFTFLLLQFDIDCFSVYGVCHSNSDSHMWNIFEYSGEYFNCDPAWDRSEGGYSKLVNFGKTDAERISETVDAIDFSTYHEAGYPIPVCQDARFSKIRGVVRFAYSSPHSFYTKDFKDRERFFNTETFTLG